MIGIDPEVRTDVFSVVSGAEFIGRSHRLVDLIHVPEGQYDSALRATFKGEDLSVDWGRGFFPGVGTSRFGISGEGDEVILDGEGDFEGDGAKTVQADIGTGS